jgi:CheY-like chemotaxis protein
MRRNILLIDDAPTERDLYELVLRPEFDILTASRGAEGVVLAEREKPDAIVLDVMMPGMDGWETCTIIKTNSSTSEIPVILLTGSDESDLSQHAVAVGASALLRKPCCGNQLRKAIVEAIARSTGR